MGLDMYDMYLKKQIFIGGKYDYKMTGEVTIRHGNGKEISLNPREISVIELDVAYWRKANAIHGWFIRNCANGEDDCRDVLVSKDDLKELYDACCTVLQEHSTASTYLPTQDGFFFGSQEYNEYYFEDVEYTKNVIEKVLAEKEPDGFSVDYYYRASW